MDESESSDSDQTLYDLEIVSIRNEDIFDYLDPSSVSISTRAIINDDFEAFKRAVLGGSDVNIPDNCGHTSLHIAAFLNRKNIAEWLLSREELNINATNHKGMTALLISITKLHLEIAILLVNAGADVNICTDDMDTPLIIAVQNNDISAAKFLIENGADVECENVHGKRPLTIAIEQSCCEMLHMLLFYGVDLNTLNHFGEAIFVCALKTRNEEIISTLFEYVCDLNDTERYYLFVALDFYNENVITSLILKGARLQTNLDFWLGLTMVKSLDIFKLIWESHNLLEMNPCLDMSEDIFSYLLLQIEDKKLCESVIDYVICSSSEEVLQHLLSVSETSSMLRKFVISALEVPIKKEKILEYCYIFLINNIKIDSLDVFTVYETFGFGTLYELLLYMDVKPDLGSFQHSSPTYLIPRLMLAIEKHDLHSDIGWLYNRLRDILKCMDYSIIVDDFVELFKRMTFFPFAVAGMFDRNFYSYFKKMEALTNIKLLDHFLRIPSLKELSRNACRKMIILQYRVKNSCQFYTIIYHLPIPLVLKEIIALKQPIYDLSDL